MLDINNKFRLKQTVLKQILTDMSKQFVFGDSRRNRLFEEVSQGSGTGRSVCRRVRDERELHQSVQPKAKTAGKIHICFKLFLVNSDRFSSLF